MALEQFITGSDGLRSSTEANPAGLHKAKTPGPIEVEAKASWNIRFRADLRRSDYGTVEHRG